MIQGALETTRRPLAHLGDDALFLVWGPPSHGPRSRVFARELGIEARFVYSTKRRGRLVAPLKYGYQAVTTCSLLLRRRPRVVFVQSPPSFAVIAVWLYSSIVGARFVVDAHSCAMTSVYWTRPRFLYRHLARRAAATIVTNDHFVDRIRRQGGRALIVHDVPTTFPTADPYPLGPGPNVMVVNTFGPDEPLAEVIEAARELPEVTFHVTGDTGRPVGGPPTNLPPNLHLTGFLPEESYYALMAASDAVMCLTTRDHTMQRGACEALWMGRPIVTSRWPLLEEYFSSGTVHVDGSVDGIREGVREIVAHRASYEAAIAELQRERRREWDEAVAALLRLLGRGAGRGRRQTETRAE